MVRMDFAAIKSSVFTVDLYSTQRCLQFHEEWTISLAQTQKDFTQKYPSRKPPFFLFASSLSSTSHTERLLQTWSHFGFHKLATTVPSFSDLIFLSASLNPMIIEAVLWLRHKGFSILALPSPIRTPLNSSELSTSFINQMHYDHDAERKTSNDEGQERSFEDGVGLAFSSGIDSFMINTNSNTMANVKDSDFIWHDWKL